MKPSSIAVLCLLSACASAQEGVATEVLRQAYQDCRAIADPADRLRCYDRLQDKLEPPRFQGRLMATTPAFTVDGPTRLRYQSDGPIFVMYLKDERGDIVQNLHIGGGGEATYLIARAGTYLLQISGSDTWRVWVEPQPAAHP